MRAPVAAVAPRFAALLLELLLVSSLLVSKAWGSGERDLRVGFYENSPKISSGAGGKPEGIFVEILEAIADREGWALTWVSCSWQECLQRVEHGEIDLLPDVALTAERDRLYAFHRVPVLSSWNQIYVRRGTDIRSLLDLERRRVAVLDGSVQQEQFEGMVKGFDVNVTLVPAPNFDQAFQSVVEDRADAVVTNRYYGVRHAASYGLVDTSIIFSPSQLYFAAPRHGDQAVLDAIDRNLTQFKQDSSSPYYASLRRWTSNEAPPAMPAWVPWATFSGAALLALAVLWGITLRRTTARLRASDSRQRQLLEDLAVARDMAESSDRMKSAFLATMSHELRTPLNSIIGFSGILLQGLAGPLNDEQAKQLGMVSTSADHLLALINDVLDLSKIEAGQLQVENERFDLSASVHKVAEAVRVQAKKKHLELELDMAPGIGEIESDRRRVEQVLINLLSNAIKFTERGRVSVVASREDGRIVIAVTDTGQGIAREDLDKLFKPFSQVDTGLARRHEGTGLGLSICKRLVDLLGGRIWVESEPGKGSTFAFELPALRSRPSCTEARPCP